MFIDRAEIKLTAGKGGDGIVSFRREIFEPHGGPDGGDGGRGGDIIFKVDTGLQTLMDFRYKRVYKADDGENGKRKNQYGKNAKALVIKVPQGTVIFEKETNKLVADLSDEFSEIVLLKGGRGGRGNTHFKTSKRQAPNFKKNGLKGQSLDVVLELKSIADVGLIGLPNVGKSSLLKIITNSKPKISNYHFTTLFPNLGLVENFDKSFIIADIPGLIEGASEGIGLGHDFLRHIERTSLLLHIIDVSSSEYRNPIEDYKLIREELRKYSTELVKRKEIVFLNKYDLVSDDDKIKEILDYFKDNDITYFLTSNITRKGIKEGINEITSLLEKIEKPDIFTNVEHFEFEDNKDEVIYYIEDGEFILEGEKIERLFNEINFFSVDSIRHFQKVLKNIGVYDNLKEMGLKDKDIIRILGYAFEYRE